MTLPLKKRITIATKTIPNLRRAAEALSNGDDEQKRTNYIQLHLQQLQSVAFQTLLKVFALEKSVNTNKRNQIIERLMIEWNITEESRGILEQILESELWEEHQRDDIPAFDTNTVIETQPLTTYVEEQQMLPDSVENEAATSMDDSGVTVASSWRGVSPQSLVGIYIQIRLPGENFTEYIIKEYDTEKDMHRLETVNANAMEEDDPFSWIDIRNIQAQDIMWQGGRNPWEGDKN